MRLSVTTGYLDPIDLGAHEYVAVNLPCGRQVTVYSDRLYVATAEDLQRNRSGKPVWEARAGSRWPYGKVCEVLPVTPAGEGQQAR